MRLQPTVLLSMCLAADAGLIIGDVLLRNSVLEDPRFALGVERGYGELLQYTKLWATATLLARLAWHAGSYALAFWAVLFAYLTLDDAFALHERMGLVLASALDLPPAGRARPGQVGEVLYLAVVGTLVLLSVLALWRSTDGYARWLSRRLVAGLVVLGLFGVGVDFLHSLLRGHWLNITAGVVEDGGELVAVTFLLWTTYRAGSKWPPPDGRESAGGVVQA